MPRSYKEDNWCDQVGSVREAVKKRDREEGFGWKGTAIQRGLEHRDREIAIVGAITRKRLVSD
jgi:hypothetical protein